MLVASLYKAVHSTCSPQVVYRNAYSNIAIVIILQCHNDIPQAPSTGESPSSLSTTILTTEEINHFNKLPKDLEQFYEQMKTGKYSSEIYRCNSTISVFTKQKRIFKHMQDYPGGIDQYFKDYKGKSPTWIYNNIVRSKRS